MTFSLKLNDNCAATTIDNNEQELLRPLSSVETLELLELYKNKLGKYHFQYLLLYNQNKWNQHLNEKLKNQPVDAIEAQKWIGFRKTFYTPKNSEFCTYGTYVSVHYDVIQSVSCYSWESNFNQLLDCLNKTKMIDWKNGPLLTNVDLAICENVKKIAISKGGNIKRARSCYGLTMSHEIAFNLVVPDLTVGYQMQELKSENAELIYSLWPNKSEASLDYIRGLIEINKTFGIYRQCDNELIAWVFQNDFAGIGILQVIENEQRKGFASILTAAICKKIAQTEDVVLNAWIVRENYKSEALLKKIGFKITEYNEWIQLDKMN